MSTSLVIKKIWVSWRFIDPYNDKRRNALNKIIGNDGFVRGSLNSAAEFISVKFKGPKRWVKVPSKLVHFLE